MLKLLNEISMADRDGLYRILEAAVDAGQPAIVEWALAREPAFSARISRAMMKRPDVILRLLDQRQPGDHHAIDLITDLGVDFPTLSWPRLMVGILNRIPHHEIDPVMDPLDRPDSAYPVAVVTQLNSPAGFWAMQGYQSRADVILPGYRPPSPAVPAAIRASLRTAVGQNLTAYIGHVL